jgi:hypothetical protein
MYHELRKRGTSRQLQSSLLVYLEARLRTPTEAKWERASSGEGERTMRATILRCKINGTIFLCK